MRPLAELRDLAVRAVEAAGEVVTGWRERDSALETQSKGRGDYVTAADRAAEAAVLEVLAAGAVGAPFTGDLWCGARGLGAHDRRGRRLQVAGDGSGVVATGFPFRRLENRDRYLRVFEAAFPEVEDLRRAGAASLDLAYSAQGAFDGYFELGLSLWDVAAGSLLVLEAGGVVTDWAGDPRGVYRSGDVLAGSPAWHERMLDIVRRAGSARAVI